MGRSSQVTTWRRYTQAEKKAYRARLRRRQRALAGELLDKMWNHYFADSLGSRVPTLRVNGERL